MTFTYKTIQKSYHKRATVLIDYLTKCRTANNVVIFLNDAKINIQTMLEKFGKCNVIFISRTIKGGYCGYLNEYTICSEECF